MAHQTTTWGSFFGTFSDSIPKILTLQVLNEIQETILKKLPGLP